MTEEDVERSFVARMVAALPNERVHEPGEGFDPEKARQRRWIRPRLADFEQPRDAVSKFGGNATFEVDCFVMVGEKAGRAQELSVLVDLVRASLDPAEGGGPVPILDSGSSTVGRWHPGPVTTGRTHDTDLTSEGVLVAQLDSATVRATGVLVGV